MVFPSFRGKFVDNKKIILNLLKEFVPYAKKQLNYNKPCKIKMLEDFENSQKPFGKTAFYNPNSSEIMVYVTDRHVKDIMRSISHELVHHTQNCRGEFNGNIKTEEGYAQKNKHLRKMEKEAYLKGNIIFRDFEDQRKKKNNNTERSNYKKKNETQKEDLRMSSTNKNWKEKLFESRNIKLMATLFANQGLIIKEKNQEIKKEEQKIDEKIKASYRKDLKKKKKSFEEGGLPSLDASPIEKSIRRKKKKDKKRKDRYPSPKFSDNMRERIEEVVRKFVKENRNKPFDKGAFVKTLSETLKKKDLKK